MTRIASAGCSAAWLAVLVGLGWFAGRPLALAEPAPPGAEPTTVELTVVGGPALNPNAQGRPSPVVVRIFDLTAARGFEAADFQGLFEQPADALKHDVVAQEEFVLRPGEIQERNRSLQPQVQALGVAAGFRDLEHAVWRLTVPLKLGRRNFLLINLDQDTIRLAPVDPGHS
jgi:type VI secretion system protein VasD